MNSPRKCTGRREGGRHRRLSGRLFVEWQISYEMLAEGETGGVDLDGRGFSHGGPSSAETRKPASRVPDSNRVKVSGDSRDLGACNLLVEREGLLAWSVQ